MNAGIIRRELLEHATDEELDAYIAWLAAETDADDVDDTETWDLQDRQQMAEDALQGLDPSMSHELLFGGAAGGGKSDFILWHLFTQCQKYPGISTLALRRTFGQLRRSLVLRSLQRFDKSVAKYVVTENTWKFANGSRLEFGYCEADLDIYNYDSAEYDIIAWDELTQMPTAFPYLYMFSRLRSRTSTLARGFVPHVIAATNPGRVGAIWVKARFVDVAPPETTSVHELVDEEGNAIAVDDDGNVALGTRVFIPSKLEDNKYISRAQYTAALANLPKDQREALLGGSWDTIEGQYFAEWDRKVHVIKPFPIPQWWTRIRAVDYGHYAPWACLWIAFDQDGYAVLYREAYERNLTPSQQCAMILASEAPGERALYTVGDPSMWSKTGAGVPIAQQYVNNRVPMRRAMNARVDGWARVREYLIGRRNLTDERGKKLPQQIAGLRVFDTCPNFIRTFPMLVHDTLKPEDLDTDGEDHAADALRYGLMSRPPLAQKPPSEAPNTPQGRMERARVEREKNRRGDRSVEHPQLGRI